TSYAAFPTRSRLPPGSNRGQITGSGCDTSDQPLPREGADRPVPARQRSPRHSLPQLSARSLAGLLQKDWLYMIFQWDDFCGLRSPQITIGCPLLFLLYVSIKTTLFTRMTGRSGRMHSN